MRGMFLTLANSSLPQVETVINLNDTSGLGEFGDKAVGVANSGAAITFKVGIVVMVILLFVAIICLAAAKTQELSEKKNKLITVAVCAILLFSVVSYMTLAQNVGSKLFTTTEATQQDDGSGGSGG